MKVFVLYVGERLGPIDKIIGIYTNEELVKNALSLCPKSTDEYNYSYFEQDLNVIPNHPEGHKAFICQIQNNEVHYLKQFSILENPILIHLFPSVTKNRNECSVFCWATDEKHAEQIALDHFKNCHES